MYCTRYIHFSVPTDTGYRIYQTVHSTADSSVCFSYNLPVNWLFNCMNNRKFKASDNSLCVGILWVPQRTFQQYAKNARSENARGLHILNSSSSSKGRGRGARNVVAVAIVIGCWSGWTRRRDMWQELAAAACNICCCCCFAAAAVVATLCCLMPGFKNDECANVSGLQQERQRRQMRHMRQPAAGSLLSALSQLILDYTRANFLPVLPLGLMKVLRPPSWVHFRIIRQHLVQHSHAAHRRVATLSAT